MAKGSWIAAGLVAGALGCGAAFSPSLGDLDGSADASTLEGSFDASTADVLADQVLADTAPPSDAGAAHDGPNICCKTAAASVACGPPPPNGVIFVCYPGKPPNDCVSDPSTCPLGASCLYGNNGTPTEEPDGWPAGIAPDGAVVPAQLGTVVDCQ